MSSHFPCLLSTTTALLISVVLFHSLILSPIFCLNHHQQPIAAPQVLLSEEKTRLGSSPPSCHNKCNGCHPCMAVQVPTIPSHSRVQPGFADPVEFSDPVATGNNKFSNYKPLGWKCRCGDHFYNP